MQPILDRILTFNLIGTTLVFYVAARLYLLLDLATADPDTGDAGLVASMAIARRAGLTSYDGLADDELGWSDQRRAKLAQAADEVVG